jgi:hypothetical protein
MMTTPLIILSCCFIKTIYVIFKPLTAMSQKDKGGLVDYFNTNLKYSEKQQLCGRQ